MRSSLDRNTRSPGYGGTDRLVTPSKCGYRAGMSSSSVIGHNLGTMYNVPSDRPDAIYGLAAAIDRKVCGNR